MNWNILNTYKNTFVMEKNGMLSAFLTYMSNSEKLTFVGRDDFQCPARSIFKVRVLFWSVTV